MFSRLVDFAFALLGHWWLLVTGVILVIEEILEKLVPLRFLKRINSWWPKKSRPQHFRLAAALAVIVACFLVFDDTSEKLSAAQTEISKIAVERDEARRLAGLPVGWTMSPDSEKALREALGSTLNRFPFVVTTVPAAGNNALDFAYRIMGTFGAVPGWGVVLLASSDAEFAPKETGLMIAHKAGTDPTKNRKAVTLKDLMAKAGLKPRFQGHNQMADGDARIVIGKNP